MECPKCKNEIKSNNMYCNICGTRFEEKDLSDTPVTKSRSKINKKAIGISGLLIIIFVLIIWGWQNGLINSTIDLYNQGEYEKAESTMGKVLFQNSLGDYSDKIEIMARIEGYLNNGEKYFNSSEMMHNVSIGYYVDTIKACIGYNDKAEEAGCLDELLSVRKEATQVLANEGYDISTVLSNVMDDDKHAFYPLCIENPDKISELVTDTVNDVSQSDVKNYQNEKNPITITKKDAYQDGEYWYCTGTVSNVDDNEHTYVEVRVTYYDDSDNVITTDWTYAVDSKGIKAGENQQFEMMTKVDGNPTKYKVEIQGYE